MTKRKILTVGSIVAFLLASALVGYMSERTYVPGVDYDVTQSAEGAVNVFLRSKAAPAPMVREAYASGKGEVERKTILNAFLTLEVKEFIAAADKVASIASRYGGYVSDSSMTNEGVGRKSGYLVVRVPEKDFNAAIAELEKIGEIKNRNVSGQDVTEQYIDVEARLGNLKAEEQRYLELLRKAEKVEDLLAIQRELSRVRGDIESMQGQLNYLKNRVELATITVNMAEPEVIVHESGLKQALDAAIEGFLSTIRGMIILLGYLLPVIVILLLIFGMWKVVKIVRK